MTTTSPAVPPSQNQIHFRKSGPYGFPLEKTMIALISVFLEARSLASLNTTASSLLLLLPQNEPDSMEVWLLGVTLIDLAFQIPYYHRAQSMLAALTKTLALSPRFVILRTLKSDWGRYSPTQLPEMYSWESRLGWSMGDLYGGAEDGRPGDFVNYMAFMARIWDHVPNTYGCHFAIWTFRDAFEEAAEGRSPTQRDEYILAAAQWILWYGQQLFTQVLTPPYEEREWYKNALKPGDVYQAQNGRYGLSLHRWHFWREGFEAVIVADQEGTSDHSGECVQVARRARDIMDLLEDAMIFTTT